MFMTAPLLAQLIRPDWDLSAFRKQAQIWGNEPLPGDGTNAMRRSASVNTRDRHGSAALGSGGGGIVKRRSRNRNCLLRSTRHLNNGLHLNAVAHWKVVIVRWVTVQGPGDIMRVPDLAPRRTRQSRQGRLPCRTQHWKVICKALTNLQVKARLSVSGVLSQRV